MALVDRIIVLENGRVAIDGPKDLIQRLQQKSQRKVMGSFIETQRLIIILVFVGFFGYWSTQVELDEMARIQRGHRSRKKRLYSPNLTGASLR